MNLQIALLCASLVLLATCSKTQNRVSEASAVLTSPHGVMASAYSDSSESPALTVALNDGSRIIGVPTSSVVPLRTSYTTVQLSLGLVSTVEFNNEHTMATINLKNGDRLRGAIEIQALKLKTLLGMLSVPLSAIVSISSIQEPVEFRQGLVAWYPFAGTGSDGSGNKRDAIVHGAVLTVDRFGSNDQAYMFDGQSNYLEGSNTRDLNFSNGGFSLAAWVEFSEDNGDVLVVAKHVRGYGNGYGLGVTGNRLIFFVNGDPRISSQRTSNDGKWHHVVGTYDGRSEKLYIDGVLECSQETEYNEFNDAPFTIGGSSSGGFFRGTIDDVRVYDRPLMLEEIKSLCHSNK